MTPPLLVSACLVGEICRYDGGHNAVPGIVELAAQGRVLALCPEMLGGLPCPRGAAEIAGERVLTRSGDDVTEEFHRGARLALEVTGAACAGMAGAGS